MSQRRLMGSRTLRLRLLEKALQPACPIKSPDREILGFFPPFILIFLEIFELLKHE